jgi:hypothetical protein
LIINVKIIIAFRFALSFASLKLIRKRGETVKIAIALKFTPKKPLSGSGSDELGGCPFSPEPL